MKAVDCVVVGGGAAGLMCAAIAGYRGKSVLLLDHANKVGKKILMSGGGRCNFTNYFIEPENYVSDNPHFCISALTRYTQYDFLALIEKHDLEYHEKTLGQLFCDNKAKDILNILLAECDMAGVDIRTHCHIHSVVGNDFSACDHHADLHHKENENTRKRFTLATSVGNISCQSLVIATGGLSIPTMGATGFGYDIAKQFGLRVKPRYASLVPYTFKGGLLALSQSLAGVSMPVMITCRDQSFKEALLFTHKGISGPAVLQISNYWKQGDEISIDFLPDYSLERLFMTWQKEGNKSEIKNLLARYLPKRFVGEWFLSHDSMELLANKTVVQLSDADKLLITQQFHGWICRPAGTEGYKTAEVTRGGVDTNEISSKTFEATSVPGLFFIGEVLDVTGWLGGYNFQWAWASGYCAAQYV